MTSIVIPLGHGSRHNDFELRYCLRSVEQYLTGYGDVFIIGRKPDWLKNVIHIPYEDQGDQSYDKERNIFCKVMAVCGDERVSGDFLFMNDDHFLLKKYGASSFPYYYNGLLSEKLTVTDYKHTVNNTLSYFGQAITYFDIHCPIRYNKQLFEYSFRGVEWGKWGYCIKTMYMGIIFNTVATEKYPDLKIDAPYKSKQIKDLLADRSWFSIGDKAFDGEIVQVLQELYANKSKYEL